MVVVAGRSCRGKCSQCCGVVGQRSHDTALGRFRQPITELLCMTVSQTHLDRNTWASCELAPCHCWANPLSYARSSKKGDAEELAVGSSLRVRCALEAICRCHLVQVVTLHGRSGYRTVR